MITIQRIHLRNFTVFSEAKVKFAEGLNIIIGENGAGKTHLLKILYMLLSHSHKMGQQKRLTKALQQQQIARSLVDIFRPDGLGRLVRRQRGRERCNIDVSFNSKAHDLPSRFATNSQAEVELIKPPSKFTDDAPAYLPTKELLSIYPGFIPLYENNQLEFDRTWFDTCVLLGQPLPRGPKAEEVQNFLKPIEEVLEGSIVLDGNGRFYLRRAGLGTIEMHLLAEGLRKFAMIARLIATGTLLEKGYLFWDEPEANLNPKLVRAAAKVIASLAASGVQIFIATHSLFLLRELEILRHEQQKSSYDQTYIGLAVSKAKDDTRELAIETAESLSGIRTIVALEESLQQSDRYMKISNF